MTCLTSLSATEMAGAIRRREVSPVELVRAHLQRIEALDGTLNAFVCVRDAATADARLAEAAMMRGEERPMLGVPISIKSCIDVAGLRCEAGSKLRDGYVAPADAPLVSRLKQAGAIILGNTNTPEFLMAYETDNVLRGRTNNPWDLERTAGGSSGGESSAIAARMSAAGVGSDGGGSIRVPAHFTGICGLKPTPGRIPGTGHFPACVGPFAYIGVVGPMARSVTDLRCMMEIMAGPDIGDPMAANYPLASVGESQLRDLRVGCFDTDGELRATRETQDAVTSAAEALRAAGLQPEPFCPAGLDEARELWETLFVRAAGMLVQASARGREGELSPMLQGFLEVLSEKPPLTAETLLQTLLDRDLLRTRFLAQMERFPILLAPVSTGPALYHGEGGWKESDTGNYLRTMRYTQWFNLLGNPVAVVPVAHSPEGLPLGVQVIGRPFEEQLVLRAAAIIEQKFGCEEPAMSWGAKQIRHLE
jgi:Asp-tRNA(Asn)/Glu-tRNA(Gln) amidotransferase A subunit family amidase